MDGEKERSYPFKFAVAIRSTLPGKGGGYDTG